MAKIQNRIHFHVVNSVKGGSGKSTFSLLLADRLTRMGEAAYVIDLDLCGTSWYGDFKAFFANHDHKYVNQLMYTPSSSSYPYDIWSKLETIDASQKPKLLNICMAGEAPEDTIYEKFETEILEYTTLRIIKDAINQSVPRYSKAYNWLHIIADNISTKYKYLKKIEPQHILLDNILHIILNLSNKGYANQLLQIKDTISTACEKLNDLRDILNKVESIYNYLFDELCILDSTLLDDKIDDKIIDAKLTIESLLYEFDDIIKISSIISKRNSRIVKDDNYDYDSQQKSHNKLIKRYWDYYNKTLSDLRDDIEKFLANNSFENQEVARLVELLNKHINDIPVVRRIPLNNKSNSIFDEKILYWIDKSNYYSKNNIHIIFDLPPNYENSIEEICQHILFDQSSKLFGEKDMDCYINLYMMTPVDQPSSKEKNVQYVTDILCGKRNYSSNISKYLEQKKFKIFFIVNDNHAFIHTLDLQKAIIDLLMDKNIWLKKSYNYDNIIHIGYMNYARLAFKQYVNIYTTPPQPNKGLDVSGYDISVVTRIIDQAIQLS